MWQYQFPRHSNSEAAMFSLVCFAAGWMGPECEVNCERSTERSTDLSVPVKSSTKSVVEEQWFCSFVVEVARCAFVGARVYHVCSIGSRRVWHHQSPGYRNAETAILSLVRFTAGLHEVRTVCQ